MSKRILAINPGSTSTKVALYDGLSLVSSQSLHHDVSELSGSLMEQLPMRKARVREFLDGERSLSAVVGRGGLLHPLPSGAYFVNDAMLHDLSQGRYGHHASNLGAFLAKDIADLYGTPLQAVIVDPVVVDEMDDIARFTGMPSVKRRSIFHALNQRAIGRRVSADLGKQYSETRLVISHMGGGITVGAHREGRVVDVSNGIDGEGPMTPERSGALPVEPLIRFCFSGKARPEIEKLVLGRGGLYAHLGSNDFREVTKRKDDPHVALIAGALACQVSKEIGRCISVLDGRVDAVVLTGGLAHAGWFCDDIEARISHFARVVRAPGEDEMLALAEGALLVLEGTEKPKFYESWT